MTDTTIADNVNIMDALEGFRATITEAAGEGIERGDLLRTVLHMTVCELFEAIGAPETARTLRASARMLETADLRTQDVATVPVAGRG